MVAPDEHPLWDAQSNEDGIRDTRRRIAQKYNTCKLLYGYHSNGAEKVSVCAAPDRHSGRKEGTYNFTTELEGESKHANSSRSLRPDIRHVSLLCPLLTGGCQLAAI